MADQPTGNGTPPQAPPPQPAPQQPQNGAPVHVHMGGTPRGTDGDPVPYWRFQEVTGKLAEAREQASKASEYQAGMQAAQAEAALWRSRYDRGMTMAAASRDLPDLAHEEVRGFISERYTKHVEQAGDEAKPFADWFNAQRENPSPLLRPYLQPAAASPAGTPPPPPQAAPPPQVRPPQAPPNIDAGAGATPPVTTTISVEERATILARGRDHPRFAEMVKQMEAEGLFTGGSSLLR